MSSSESNSSEPGIQAPPPRPHGASTTAAVLVMALLAALVWALRPDRLGFEPAPLRPLARGCPKVVGEFVPTNFTEAPGLSLESLTKEQKNRVLFRLNMEPCPCGCKESIAACLVNHPQCETATDVAKKIVAEERGERPNQAGTK
jgi:hypothetical protein